MLWMVPQLGGHSLLSALLFSPSAAPFLLPQDACLILLILSTQSQLWFETLGEEAGLRLGKPWEKMRRQLAAEGVGVRNKTAGGGKEG